jgi:ribosomal protein S18 acetylase RimI-like enzyme
VNANAVVIADTYTLSDASLFDLPAIWRLERACFPQDAYDILTLLGLAVAPHILRLKAVADRQLVGYTAGEVRAREQLAWIVTIGVLPQYQGRGIGKALLSNAERAMGMPAIKLTVRRSNLRAIRMYESCGYQWVNTIRRYYHDGEDGLIMAKEVLGHRI